MPTASSQDVSRARCFVCSNVIRAALGAETYSDRFLNGVLVLNGGNCSGLVGIVVLRWSIAQ
jgi:hypothetical protein